MKTLVLITLLAISQLNADTVGGEVSLGVFSHSPSGSASYEGSTQDLEKTFDFSNDQDIIFKAYVEHPLPFIPNIKVGYSNISHDATSGVSNFTWDDIDSFTGDIDSSLEIKSTDFTLYYELVDIAADLDFGLTLRHLDGSFAAKATSATGTAAFDTWIPMVYVKGRVPIPMTGVSFQLEANSINYDDIKIYDYEISARYTFTMGLGLEAGYKAFHLDSGNLTKEFKADLDFSGVFISAVWDF